MLALGRVLVGRPSIVLLDEPSEGVQPSLVEAMCDSLSRIVKDTRLAILVVEQNVDVVSSLANRALTIERGCIGRELTTEDVASTTTVAAALAL